MAVVMTRVNPSILPPTIITAPTSEIARPKAVISTISSASRASQASSSARIAVPAPQERSCSPCKTSASSTAWRDRAAATGNTSTAWASTMAWKLNSQPQAPSGPERDSSKYTSKPTTTEGTASSACNTVSTAPRPVKRATPR